MDSFVSFTKTWHNKPYAAIDPKRPELQVPGKFVVVTGGGTGIGKAISTAFAQAGAKRIAILGRRLGKLESAAADIKKAGADYGHKVEVLVASADISQRSVLDAAVSDLVRRAGGAKVDILVSNAGVAPDLAPVEKLDHAELKRGWELNVVGAFNVVQSFAPVLAANAYIYNISSGMAHIKPVPGFWAYSAVKAAVARMFDYLQDEHPAWHIVQIQPGVIATEINERFSIASQDEPELVGQFLVWLASPEAVFLKGKFVWVNWDVDELKARADEIKDSLLFRIVLNGAVM